MRDHRSQHADHERHRVHPEVPAAPVSKGVPIILLTTESSDDLKREAKEAGARAGSSSRSRQGPVAGRDQEGDRRMSSGSDPTDTFRQEASELLEQLELSLLDLEQTPDNADLGQQRLPCPCIPSRAQARCSAFRKWRVRCTSSRRPSTRCARACVLPRRS